jgi:hypothetical protein
MGEQDNEFGAAPEAVSSDGWNIVDGGMERESAEDLAATLAADNPTADPAADAEDQTAEDRAAAGNDEAAGDVTKPARAGASSAGNPAKPAASAPAAKQRPIERRVSELRAEINSLTGQRHRTRAEAEAAKMELADLQRKLEVARLDLAKGHKTDGDKQDEAAPVAAKPAYGALKRPVWKEFDAEGKDWDEFLEAQDAYLEARIEQSTGKTQAAFQAELDRLRQDADSAAHEARIAGEHGARVRAAKSAHPDFAEAIANLRDVEQTPFMADVVRMHSDGAELLYQLGKNPDAASVLTSFDFTREMFNAVMESKNPAGVLLALASDPDEFARLRALPASQVMFALGALDARSSASGTRERPATRGASISNAPAPIRPVGGVGKAPADDDDANDDELPYEQWKAREDARDAKKHRIGAY